MSLLVFSKDTLYADDRFHLDVPGMPSLYAKDKKIHVDKNKHFAVGVVGSHIPTGLMNEIMETISTVVLMDTLYRRHSGTDKDNSMFKKYGQEIAIKMFRQYQLQKSTLLAMSKTGAIKLDHLGYSELVPSDDTVMGSGTTGFVMMRLAGYSVEAAYAAINRAYSTVGPLAQTVSRSELVDWPDRDKKIKKIMES